MSAPAADPGPNDPPALPKGSSQTAEGLMTPDPVSLLAAATAQDALKLFTTKAVNAAAVIDEAGRPVGVLSQTDLLIHFRQAQETAAPASTSGAQAQAPPQPARVRDLMTPAVFAVTRTATADKVVGDLLSLKVHQLFVVDEGGVLIGVICASDVLRHLQGVPKAENGPEHA